MPGERGYLKVVTNEFQSLGLRRNPNRPTNILTYPLGIWVRLLPDQIIRGKGPWSGEGGIGIVLKLSEAKGLVRYMFNQHGVPCLICHTEIDEILYINERKTRAKTNAVKLTEIVPFET